MRSAISTVEQALTHHRQSVPALPPRHPELLLAVDELPRLVWRTCYNSVVQTGGGAAAEASRWSKGKSCAMSRDVALSSSLSVNRSLNQGRLATNSTVGSSSPTSHSSWKHTGYGRV